MEKYGIIINDKLFSNIDGNNINGPCLIKVPEFVKNKIGNYYLYFGHHEGLYIRMAYSDNILGPYTIYQNGVLHLKDIIGYDHLASPDVIINYKNKKLIMYYHCFNKNAQSTFYAYSDDGITFNTEKINILYPYFRYFVHKKNDYGICMNGRIGSIILKKEKKVFQILGLLLPKSRHTSIITINNRLFVFYSIVGDCPEHIYVSEITSLKKNNIKINKKLSIIKPDLSFESNNIEPKKSNYGIATKDVNELRDPYVYLENDIIYILYTFCGEKGIAIATITISNFITKFFH